MIAAKKAKNDEFYTQLSDISAELTHQEYLNEFRGKWIYCNCDNPEISQFYRFFVLYFQQLELSRLTCTYLAGTSGSKNPVAYRYDIYGDLNGNGIIDDGDIEITQLTGNGSFDSPECLEILQACDVVVTNPPFSLFRPYLDLLMRNGKKFAIIANMNSISDQIVFKAIKEEKIWLGYNSPKQFIKPDGGLQKFGNIIWWTNVDLQKRHQPLLLVKEYTQEDYPKYDNYNAIECSRVSNIPKDYYGYIGVPITFLGNHCPEQFDIVGIMSSHGKLPKNIPNENGYLNGKWCYTRLLIINKMAYLYWFLIIERNGRLYVKIDTTMNQNLSNEINGKLVNPGDLFCFNKNIGSIKNDKTNITQNIDQDKNEVTPEYLYKKFINFFDSSYGGMKKCFEIGFDSFMERDLREQWDKFKNLSFEEYDSYSGFFLTDNIS